MHRGTLTAVAHARRGALTRHRSTVKQAASETLVGDDGKSKGSLRRAKNYELQQRAGSQELPWAFQGREIRRRVRFPFTINYLSKVVWGAVH